MGVYVRRKPRTQVALMMITPWKSILWVGLTLPFIGCSPGEPESARPTRVGPDNSNSTFSYYGASPESPDGLLIAYVKLLNETKLSRKETVPRAWTMILPRPRPLP